MSNPTNTADSAAFQIGWIVLLVATALFTVLHILLMFTMEGETTLFMGWAAFNLITAIVLCIPFRRNEKWAWYATWIQVIGFMAPILVIRESFVVMYMIAAGVMALGLLLTRPAFFSEKG
jgi:hypothetical protein